MTSLVLAVALAVRPACPAPATDDFFFPAGLLHPTDAQRDRSKRHWFSRHLRVMTEPSRSCGAAGVEVYRFLLLPTRSTPVAVRITRSPEGSVRVVAVELTGAGGYDPGKIDERSQRTLPAAAWDKLQAALRRAGFWSMPIHVPSYGADGAQWVVEGRRGGHYHVVDRWSPGRGPYRDLGELFEDLGDL